MKSLKFVLLFVLAGLLVASCKKGLDPIKEVAPGPDLLPPTLVIDNPVDGKLVRLQDTVITIKLVAEDDIELKSVTIDLDGVQIGQITSFKDYRRAAINFPFSHLYDGDHILTVTALDQTGKTDVKISAFKKITSPPYEPMEGEVIYFSFDGFYLNLIDGTEATVKGSPSFVSGKLGDAYAGATDSYLEYPSASIATPEFSLAFWYKLNPDPSRAGLISISPPGEVRKYGFRFLRENSATQMKFGINYGIGTDEVWLNPFMQIDPSDEWMHFAFTLNATSAKIYLNGEVIKENLEVKGPPVWTDCPTIVIASGAPNFTYWEHFSDLSYFDEMHFFNRAITADDVLKLYNVKKK